MQFTRRSGLHFRSGASGAMHRAGRLALQQRTLHVSLLFHPALHVPHRLGFTGLEFR